MPLDIQIQRRRSDEPDYVAVLHAWHDQFDELDVDAIASKLARSILEQQPSTGIMNESFLIRLDDRRGYGCEANERRTRGEREANATSSDW